MVTFIVASILATSALPPIEIERIVAGAPAEVFDLWVTPEGIRTFFAPAAVVEPRVGGAYTIIFEPEHDPEGLSHGTKGARILEFERGRKLMFEWITFTSRTFEGASGPPLVPEAERNARPFPTKVAVTFEPLENGRTRVRLTHSGFPRGEKWEEAHRFFTVAWQYVMDGLVRQLTPR